MTARTNAARACRCGRILLPTREGLWPRHIAPPVELRDWCPHGDLPIPGRVRG